MDRSVLDEKFDSIARCIARIESKYPFTLAQLTADFDLQDVVCLNLERAVQGAVDVAAILTATLDAAPPRGMAATFEALQRGGIIAPDVAAPMRHAVACRNIMVHEYTRIDWRIVHAIVTQHLDDFRRFVAAVDAWAQ